MIFEHFYDNEIEVEVLSPCTTKNSCDPAKNDRLLTYEGEKDEDNCPHGEGLMHYTDGSLYKGCFKHGVCHGLGVLRKPSKDSLGPWETYTGEFRRGVPHGQGQLKRYNGNVFKGTFEYGLPHGEGILTTPHGTYNSKYDNGVCMARHPVTWMVPEHLNMKEKKVITKTELPRKQSLPCPEFAGSPKCVTFEKLPSIFITEDTVDSGPQKHVDLKERVGISAVKVSGGLSQARRHTLGF